MKRKRFHSDDEFGGDDPPAGVPDLFDVGLVFIVGLPAPFFSAYHLRNGTRIYAPE